MDNQDWNPVVFNNTRNKNPNNTHEKSNKNPNNTDKKKTEYKFVVPKNLGQTISQARNSLGKTQKSLATELGIAPQILSQWENGKFMPPPTNLQIANMEKILKTRLPRLERIPITEE